MKILSWLLGLFSQKELVALEKSLRQNLLKNFSYSERVNLNYSYRSRPDLLKSVEPPFRPSSGDVAVYSKNLPKLSSKSRVLILGSTPALRDLIFRAGVKNYLVADFNLAMILNNTELCKEAVPESEIWIKSDWRALPLPANSLDLVLGDLVLFQFLPKEQPEFLAKISELLKPGGRFLIRTHFTDPNIFQKSPDEIIARAVKNPESEEKKLLNLLFSRLRDRLRDPKTQTTRPDDMIIALERYKYKNEAESKLLQKLIQAVKRREENAALEYINQTLAENESLFEQYFKIVGKEAANDYEDSNFFPVYTLGK